MPNFPSLILTGQTPGSTYQNLVIRTGSYLVNSITGDSFFDLSSSGGGTTLQTGSLVPITSSYAKSASFASLINPIFYGTASVSGTLEFSTGGGGAKGIIFHSSSQGNSDSNISWVDDINGEKAYIRFIYGHGGATGTELVILAYDSIALYYNQFGTGGRLQIGPTGVNGGRATMQYTAPGGYWTSRTSDYNYTALNPSYKSQFFTFADYFNTNNEVGMRMETFNSSGADTRLRFYPRVPGTTLAAINADGTALPVNPGYVETTTDCIMMGEMLQTGWNMRGQSIKESKRIVSTTTCSLDFNDPHTTVIEASTSSVFFTSSNSLYTNTVNNVNKQIILRTGPFNVTASFPGWCFVPNIPSTFTSQSAIVLNVSQIGTSAADTIVTYQTGSYTFAYDSDAQIFFTSASITNSIQKYAVHYLASELKAANFWNRLDAVYPFVGGTSGSHAINLISGSRFRISWQGGLSSSVSHSANGVTGNGVDGYGNTNFSASANGINYKLNSASFFVYNATQGGTGVFMGASDDIIGAYSIWTYDPSTLAVQGLNGTSVGIINGGRTSITGSLLVTRWTSTTEILASPQQITASFASDFTTTTTAVPLGFVGILAKIYRSDSSANQWSTANLRGAHIGGAFFPEEYIIYKRIWDNYNNILGRACF